jgi:hypothetical protein
MYVLIDKKGNIINEGDLLSDPDTGRVGTYTGWMPPHQRNPEGLAYIKFKDKKWEDSFLPPNIDCKLVDI